MCDRTITFSEDEVAEIITLIQTYAGDGYDTQSDLMDRWFLSMLNARLAGEPDPDKPSEAELAQERYRPIIKEGTTWRWHGGFDGAYVDTGEEPSPNQKFFAAVMSMATRFDTPFISGLAFPETVTVGDYSGTMEWGMATPDE